MYFRPRLCIWARCRNQCVKYLTQLPDSMSVTHFISRRSTEMCSASICELCHLTIDSCLTSTTMLSPVDKLDVTCWSICNTTDAKQHVLRVVLCGVSLRCFRWCWQDSFQESTLSNSQSQVFRQWSGGVTFYRCTYLFVASQTPVSQTAHLRLIEYISWLGHRSDNFPIP